ncbi:alpha/beta fold hydrolase [Coralloluteibacterium thermophilus]|uniref:Alpha/beta fold hydrolase n=1 Tax=Coralloluteibacterium thermophilum TaxID=2707049 RepID=A0ABV9NKF6_9GAMM
MSALHEQPLAAADGHRWRQRLHRPEAPRAALLWLPAMGVAARNYDPLAQALAAGGIAVALHEWRGIGSSSLRAHRGCDWGYRALLEDDLPPAMAALRRAFAGLPVLIGGHSLGGQFSMLYAARRPGAVDGIALVGSGTPEPSGFAGAAGLGMPFALRLIPLIAAVRGHFPGRRFRFAGNEARGIMRDWARSGRERRYRAQGLDFDFDAAMGGLELPVLGLLLAEDAFAPRASLDNLLGRAPRAATQVETLDAAALGTRADHFAWMRQPEAVAARMLAWQRALRSGPAADTKTAGMRRP